MWTQLRASILNDVIQQLCPQVSVKIVEKLHQIFTSLKVTFNVQELETIPPLPVYCPPSNNIPTIHCRNYDQQLTERVSDYINGTSNEFIYMLRPEFTDQQLKTIQYALETVISLLMHEKIAFTNLSDVVKCQILAELSKDYNLANDKFAYFYDELFNNMNIHLNKEYGPNKDNSRRLKNKIIDQGHNLDHVLFTRIILLARAELLV